MLPKAVVIGCRGGSSIKALDGIFIFEFTKVSPTTTGHTQEGKRSGGTTTTHSRSSYHRVMLESTPYLLKSATWTDDPTQLLSITGYCWEAVEIPAQQAGVPSTKKKTFIT